MNSVTNISTRYALIKRAEKILAEIDQFFEDASDFGLTIEDADPNGELVKIRKGLLVMLLREGRLSGEGGKRG